MLFYNLLIVNASNYPRRGPAASNNVQDVYPNMLPGSATADFNPLAAWTNSTENTENAGEPVLQPLLAARARRDYMFEVGYTGSRGSKGINQID